MAESDTQTATVETLVAEVRVLMVGSRQVTLSVAKQLDVVDLEAVAPFGRVRVDGELTVIGRCLKTGALVKARYARRAHGYGHLVVRRLDPPMQICAGLRKQSRPSLSFRGYTLLLDDGAYAYCQHETHLPYTSYPRCDPIWSPGPHAAALMALIVDHEKRAALDAKMAALPLIVLAGLK